MSFQGTGDTLSEVRNLGSHSDREHASTRLFLACQETLLIVLPQLARCGCVRDIETHWKISLVNRMNNPFVYLISAPSIADHLNQVTTPRDNGSAS